MHAAIALGSALIVGASSPSCHPCRQLRRRAIPRYLPGAGCLARSDGYEFCLSQGDARLAMGRAFARPPAFARVTVEAREACLGYGLQPQTAGFSACIDRETYARGLMVHATCGHLWAADCGSSVRRHKRVQ